MTRVGKYRIIDEHGKEVRIGAVRESDFGNPKLFGMFTLKELFQYFGAVIVVVFTAGTLWAGIQAHMTNQDKDFSTFIQSFAQFKNDDASFHKLIFQKFDEKDARLNCIEDSVKGCCPNSQNC